MWKLLVILDVVKLYARIDIFKKMIFKKTLTEGFRFQKDFSGNIKESNSLFLHFMTKAFKVTQRNAKITI